MTGKQLLAKLKESGTGEGKIAAVQAQMTDETSAAEVCRLFRLNGNPGTADKALAMLAEAGVTLPGITINADAGLKSALEECKATNTKLRADLREANAAAEANANKAKALDAKVAELESKLADAKTVKTK